MFNCIEISKKRATLGARVDSMSMNAIRKGADVYLASEKTPEDYATYVADRTNIFARWERNRYRIEDPSVVSGRSKKRK